jgi:hypothetical protein
MIFTLIGYLLRPGTLVHRWTDGEALRLLSDELIRLDREPKPT